MPRRNITCLLLMTIVWLACYQRVPESRYGRVLAGALDRVSHHYYKPVTDETLFEGAMQGMMGRLDRHSEYVTPDRKSGFEERISRQFGGVGIHLWLDPKTKQLAVISPMFGTPAFEGGILPGDRILKIDDTSTQGMSLEDAVERMHGKIDTPVTLLVLHEGQEQPVGITLVRKIIREDTVLGDSRRADGTWDFFLPGSDRIGYVRVTAFADSERTDGSGKKVKTTVADLKESVQGLIDQGMRGLILDLRDNPGGSLRAAVEMCDLFVPSGVIVTTRDRNHNIRRSFEASGRAPFTDFPLVVLVNGESASASEIVAACLQDHRRAAVVGQRSFGKGTVQEVVDLGETFGSLKLTIATYWRPSEKNIDRGTDESALGDGKEWGVRPDPGCEVVVDKEEAGRLRHAWQQRSLPQTAAKPPAGPNDSDKPVVDRALLKAVERVEKGSAE